MIKTKELSVEGMSCANCALSVTKAIEKKGGTNIHVDFMSGETLFDLDENIELEEIKSAISNSGYSVSENTKEEKPTSKYPPFQLSLIISALCSSPLLLAMFFPINGFVQAILAAVVVGIGSKHFLKSGIGSIKSGIANMDVLVLLGAYASFGYSLYNLIVGGPLFFETAGIIITLVILGKYLEKKALVNAQDQVKAFSKLLPQTATKVSSKTDQEGESIKVDEVKPGYLILVRSGEKVPADGTLLSGSGYLNESLLTGESDLIEKNVGQKVIAGSVNDAGSFVFMASKVGRNTYLSSIVELVKKAKSQKPDIQKTADRIAAVFVPIVVMLSIFTFLGWLWFGAEVKIALLNAVSVLVISCPCAMGLATPTAVTVALGRAAKSGIFFKSATIIEGLNKTKHLIFDKTGTLTTGNFSLKEISLKGETTRQDVVNVVYGLEQLSLHPIAKSLVQALRPEKKLMPLLNTKEIKGKGVYGEDTKGNQYLVGKQTTASTIGVFKNDQLIAELTIEDEVRGGANAAINNLKQKMDVVMLSGDHKEKCNKLATYLGIEKVLSQQTPEQKLSIISNYNEKGLTVFVGDGINDGPSLSKAAIGVSLAKATDVAIASADIVINENNFFKHLVSAFELSHKTLKSIKQNLFWAFFYNAIAIPISMAGLLNPMVAAGAMSLSSLFVVGNSLRLKQAIR